MLKLNSNEERMRWARTRFGTNSGCVLQGFSAGCAKKMLFALLTGTLVAAVVTLSACGSGGSSAATQNVVTLTGNWQFTMAAPADGVRRKFFTQVRCDVQESDAGWGAHPFISVDG